MAPTQVSESNDNKQNNHSNASSGGFFKKINDIFQPIDNKLGPSKINYKPGCDEDKQMFLQCVLNSPCYKKYNRFKYCAQDGVDKQCKAIRYQYYLCKRSMMFWNKAFSQDDPRKV